MAGLPGEAALYSDARILIVDDEAANVRLLQRILGQAGYVNVSATTDSREVSGLVAGLAPDLVLLDLHMPHRDGFEVLAELRPVLDREFLPVLVLTADVDRAARKRALSGGAKDFLTKPLDTVEVLLRIHNLLETRFLYEEERILREQTLQASIQALTDVLALVSPAGFSRALRASRLVAALLSHLEVESKWEIEVAAMLSQVGVVTLDGELVEKLYYGRNLTQAESATVARLPAVASRVVSRIPRLEGVGLILAHQNDRFDGKGVSAGGLVGEEIPLGARILKLLLDVDVLETRGMPAQLVMETIHDRAGWYDPGLVAALAGMREIELRQQEVLEVELRSVYPGMVLAEDVTTTTGILLVARGQEVSPRLVERLRNAGSLLEPKQRVHVLLPPPPAKRVS